MQNELMLYVSGNQPVPKHDRAVTKQAKNVYDEVRLSALKADGALALGAHVMNGVVELDAKRRELTAGDPVLDLILTEVQITAMRRVRGIQDGLFNQWGL